LTPEEYPCKKAFNCLVTFSQLTDMT